MTFRLLAFARVCMILALLSTLTLSGQAPAAAQEPAGAAAPAVSESSGLIFVENSGQFPNSVRFQVRGPDFTLWLAEDAIWLMVFEPAANSPDGVLPLSGQGVNIKLSFPGANPHPHLEPFDRLETHVSFFTGSGPDQWRADVPVWGGVRYVDLYPGLDLVLTGQQGRMLPQLEAQPGADLSAVCLRVEGAETVTVEAGGLRLAAVAGQVTYTWPLIQAPGLTPGPSVQPAGASSFDVTTPFTSTQDSPLPATHKPESRVQNPELLGDLLYSTFLGGSDIDGSGGIAVDRSGAAYITGYTYSSDLPSTPGAFDTSHNGSGDAFVAKLNAAGSGLDYATFLGGGGEDWGRGIAVDRSGSAYVTGSSGSAVFPTTPGAFDTSHNGDADVFVVKLSADGSTLEYGTFLGGADADYSQSIALDDSGAAYVTGSTSSADWPTTPGAFDTGHNGDDDAFAAKLNASGSALDYATFLGGESQDRGMGIAVGHSGQAYVAGITASSNLPATPGAFDTSHNGGDDAFVIKLNAGGSALDYATFVGGESKDWGWAIAVDGTGAAYVSGETESSDLPTTPGAFDTSYNYYDGFVAKLNPDGSALDYATFLGGSWYEYETTIAVDGCGAAYVTGITGSSDLPTTPGAFDTSHNGGDDAYAIKLNAAGSGLDYATFLGASDGDSGRGIALDWSGTAYITAYTLSTDFPTTPGAFDTTYNGGFGDASVVKLAPGRQASFSILGRVVDADGQGLPGTTISTGWGGTATTSVGGHYAFCDVLTGTVTLTPTLEGYSFDPITRTVIIPPNAIDQDFVGSPLTYSISGQVTDVDDNPMPNVTISVAGSYSTTTDALGVYTLTELLSGTYVLTPTLADYRFEPVTRTVDVPPDATGQDFRGEPVSFSVYLPLVIRRE